VLDYPGWTLHLGRRRGTCNGSIAGLECGGDGGGDALFIADDSEGVNYSLVAFSAGLPGSIHLSQLPDPRSICKVLEAPDADGWKETMDRWVLHQKFVDGVFKINNASLVARGDQQHPSIDYDESYPTWWVFMSTKKVAIGVYFWGLLGLEASVNSVDSCTCSGDWLPVSPGQGAGATCQEDWSPIPGQGTGDSPVRGTGD